MSRKESAENYRDNNHLFIPIRDFALHSTSLKLWRALLPKKFRSEHKPVKKGIEPEPHLNKLRDFDSLVRLAKKKGYLESSKDVYKDEDGDNEIRVSPEGDDFVTYFGGLESILTTYPRTWTLIATTLLSPVWIPIVQNHVIGPLCNIINLCSV